MSHPARTVKAGVRTQKQKHMYITEARFLYLDHFGFGRRSKILCKSSFSFLFLVNPNPHPTPGFSPHGQSPRASKQASKHTKKSYRPVYIYIYVFTMQRCNTSSSLKKKKRGGGEKKKNPGHFDLLCKFIGKHK